MGVQEHRHAAPPQLLEEVAHDPAADRIECARGLVEQQQPRRAHERLRDAEALLHPLGHGVDLGFAGRGQANQLEQLRTLGLSPLRARQSLMKLEQLARGQPAGKAKQLGEVADGGTGLG